MGKGQVQNDGSGASVKDPMTGLEILSKPPKYDSIGRSTENAFGKRFFTNRNQLSINVILYYGLMNRINHKGKKYRRMLMITRNHVLVAYAGGRVANIRHGDAILCRCIPITSIDEAIVVSNDKKRKKDESRIVALRVNCKTSIQFDLLFTLERVSDVDTVLNILQKCYSTLVPTKKLKCVAERDRTWDELQLDLKKPNNWKLVTDPDALPVISAMDLIKAQNQQKQREVKIVTLKESTSGTVMRKTPEIKPVPSHALPPVPKLASIRDAEIPATAMQTLTQSEVETAYFLKKQLEELHHQSELLSHQQEMQLASLNASQQIVSLVVNDKNRKMRSPSPEYEHHIHMDIASDDDSDGSYSDMDNEDIGHDILKKNKIPSPRPPPRKPRSPSPVAVTHLERELQNIRKDLSDELGSKDNQIEALRLALVGMMNEGNKTSKETDNESLSQDSDGSELTQLEIDALVSEAQIDYDEELSSSHDYRHGTIPQVSEPDSDTERLAETHAKSIQTRRREVEELLKHVSHLEQSQSQSPDDIQALRMQLKSVLHDLEIEALSYQDGFITGLPVTQQIESLPPPTVHQLPSRPDYSLSGGLYEPQSHNIYQSQQQQQQQQDAYWQWANYYNYLSTSGYGNAYPQYGQQQQQQHPPSFGENHRSGPHHERGIRGGSDDAAASEDSESHQMWRKWKQGR